MRKSKLLHFVILWMVVFNVTGSSGARQELSKRRGRHRDQYDQHGPIKYARCEIICTKKSNRKTCMTSCLNSHLPKLGSCTDEVSVPLNSNCFNSCRTHADCPDMLICCEPKCGATCQVPSGLNTLQGLPAVPTNVSILERSGQRVHLWWNVHQNKTGKGNHKKILYILEERHHIGKLFVMNRLSYWNPIRGRFQKTSTTFRNNSLRPGRWYQFRVASINENGTRGYSEPTRPMILSTAPRRPGTPLNLTVGPLLYNEQSLIRTTCKWTPPAHSDLPIQKYKIFWSIILQGFSPISVSTDSVVMSSQTVPKDVTSYELTNLKNNTQYFLQVQAITQYGGKSLKSELAGLVLNISNPETENNSSKRRAEKLTVQKLYQKNGILFARVSWSPDSDSTTLKQRRKYTVHWKSGQCFENNTYASSESNSFYRVTNMRTLELYGLKFNCKYHVEVTVVDEHLPKLTTSFKTPPYDQQTHRSKLS